VARKASRRTVAERAALARSITIATRPSPSEPGRDAWSVTQPSWAGEISRMVDGKAAEHWFQMDMLTMFEQLGLRVVPIPDCCHDSSPRAS
jgi:hypothetical protein